MTQLSFTIIQEQKGLRLDQVLVLTADGMSRNRAASLIGDGYILVDGLKKRPGYRVKTGQRITGTVIREPVEPVPEDIPLNVLHEDAHILVLDKPYGLVVHPAAGNISGTLVNGLLAHDKAFKNPVWDPFRPGIVHRLDKDTSGLILVAKTAKSLEFLQKEFKHRRVVKQYLALVQGDQIPDTGTIELPIGRHPKHRKMMTIVEDGGKYAKTAFRVQRRFKADNLSGALVEVCLYTGRTHQIRVHFYHQRMPILGDRVYQQRSARRGNCLAPRQMLHAWRLSFRHPYSGELMSFQVSVPRDFRQTMDKLIFFDD